MHIARALPDLRDAVGELRASRGALALVPTMGALHDGHRALVRAAVASGAATVTSIFVNPLQFAASEDLSRYPRDEAGDLAILRASGCDLVWMPDVATMYPDGGATTIDVGGPAENWEGAARPGHFRGVATVCAKLFGQVRPDRAYFGEKDWQQSQVVRRMVEDLLLPLSVVGVETVRERDSRAELRDAGFDVDYFALVDGATLTEIAAPRPGARLIAAARLGSVRLLDNVAA